MVTIYANIYSDQPHYIEADAELERIRSGKSKAKVEQIRTFASDKEKADVFKKDLPSVVFAGKFGKRRDDAIIEHSNLLVLDFDEVEDIEVRAAEITSHDFIYALWLSPRGNGLKALIKIADGKKHREHFAALLDIFPDADPSGVNISRVCYESYDPNLVENKEAKTFTKIKVVKRVEETQVMRENDDIFRNVQKWLANRNDAFVSGERNTFIFKLAGALCRYGVGQDVALSLILREYPTSNDFTDKETEKAVKSAYRVNRLLAGTVFFDSKSVLTDRVTMKELKIEVEDGELKLRDVVYGQDVKAEAFKIYRNGYEFITPIGIPAFDKLFKMRRADLTLLTGYGNYGKSMFKKWYQVMRAVLFDEKFASFPPEDYPVHNYYHELTEILLGCECTNSNPMNPVEAEWNAAYEFISSHFFYIYPKDISPTPEYIKQKFLELIIKEKVSGCDIDPFNQMTNDYRGHGYRDDKYLETVLADFLRFAQQNNVYFWIVAHPIKSVKAKDGNYPCPDVFELAGGSMWNNKMHNILVYHRPFMQTDPNNPLVEFHTKKIKDQKTVGSRGFILFDFNRKKRRFEFEGIDYLELALEKKKMYFGLAERTTAPF